jgi:hypothetical protein
MFGEQQHLAGARYLDHGNVLGIDAMALQYIETARE